MKNSSITIRFDELSEDRIKTFWSYSTKDYASDNECWNWLKCKDQKGYGFFRINKKMVRAHRLSYMIYNKIDEIPEGMLICHKCDNPPCINPKHLFIGTPHDNSQDCLIKNRNKCFYGNENWNSKLNEKEVIEIRDLYYNNIYSMKELGNIYEVTRELIGYIVIGTIWKNIGGHIREVAQYQKVSQEDVNNIRSLRKSGVSVREISLLYPISERHIRDIINYRRRKE